jgi:hypothetical protein
MAFSIEFPRSCDNVATMLRLQAILVIISLLSTPLAILARTTNAGMSDCDGMCCLPHGSHHSHGELALAKPYYEETLCHHGAAGHMLVCSVKSGHHRMVFGLNTPVEPMGRSPNAVIARPNAFRRILAPHAEFAASGFLSPPFEPPKA